MTKTMKSFFIANERNCHIKIVLITTILFANIKHKLNCTRRRAGRVVQYGIFHRRKKNYKRCECINNPHPKGWGFFLVG
jgi:hypothetical protein